ncbi:MAG: YkvA family protein [Gemmatimonadota bacterium]|nr:YkvA family protein [Gemmatimonadota bacterium]
MPIKDRFKDINEGFIRRGAEKINEKDLEKVLDRAEEIKDKIKNSGALKKFIEDVRILIDMLRDYWSGEYRKVPFWVIAAVAFALLYVLTPLDLIPDFIPVIGLTDDALVVGLCLMMIEKELEEYKKWRIARGEV